MTDDSTKYKYKFSILQAAIDFVADLPEKNRQQIAEKIAFIRIDPIRPGTVQLKGKEWNFAGLQARRIRAGDYRVIYTFDKEALAIQVIIIDNRSDVYR